MSAAKRRSTELAARVATAILTHITGLAYGLQNGTGRRDELPWSPWHQERLVKVHADCLLTLELERVRGCVGDRSFLDGPSRQPRPRAGRCSGTMIAHHPSSFNSLAN